jgi:hypothetical protein
LLTKYLDG